MTRSTLRTVVLVGIILGGVLSASPAAAQPLFSQVAGENVEERGIPFPSEHFAAPTYQENPQNWAIAQDERNLLYVANNNGVLQYDGERWRLIPTSTGSIVRSLGVDSLVYVGAKGDFGYLRPDSLGTLRYRSLYDQIPEGKRDFADVWKTHATPEGVYYQASDRLFRWDGEEITTWESETSFHTSFTVEDTLYVRESERGLLKMKQDSLRLATGGEFFADMPIHLMAPHPSGDLLLGTENDGLFLYDGQTTRPYAPQLTSYFAEHDLYHGCALPGNRYALATLGGGVLIIGADGQAQRLFNSSTKLPDEVVNYVYSGTEGELWMALNNDGVYRANAIGTTTRHDERTGLSGVIRSINRHDGTLHVATGSGLYILQQETETGRARFDMRDDIPLSWTLTSAGESHLAGTNNGVYRIDREEAQKVSEGFTYDLEKSEQSDLVFAGTRSGITVLKSERGDWTPVPVDGIDTEIRSIATAPDSSLWAATVNGEVIRAVLSDDHRRIVEKTIYGGEDGLPRKYKEPTNINGEIFVRSEAGIYQIENPNAAPENWRFHPRSSLLPTPSDSTGTEDPTLKSFFEDDNGTLWAAFDTQVFRSPPTEQGQQYDWRSFSPLHFPKSSGVGFYVDPDSTIWLAHGQDLTRSPANASRQARRPEPPFRALIRQVTRLSDESVVFGGDVPMSSDTSLTLPYASNNLRIEVAAPSYAVTGPHRYQYKLAGHSDGWSNWGRTANATYANLWEGTYQFQVRARNSKGEVSQTGTLQIHIEPPWYRTRWAYLLYGIGFLLFAFGFRHYQNIRKDQKRAKRQAKKLRREQEAKRKLQHANERLQEANRLKEEFLANTSHELRTPLTNILGFIDVLRETPREEQEKYLDALEKNGKRLERTLNALLSLSRLRSEKGETDLEPKNVSQCARQITSEFQKDAEAKDLSLRLRAPSSPVYARANEQYLRQILRNLIENAIKYTEDGHVTVSITEGEEEVCLMVSDTGIGIDHDFLPEVFEEFKQESHGKSRTYEGYGLGLAISARLATLMDGQISVESEKGVGSTFTVHLVPAPVPQKNDVEETQPGESLTTDTHHPN